MLIKTSYASGLKYKIQDILFSKPLYLLESNAH